MRTRRILVGITAVVALVVGATSVAAQSNAGTVKIFDGDKELPANDPKVCGPFTVQGLGFEANETVDISIVGHGGPNAGTGSFNATVTVASDGSFATAPITLSDGMYKLDSEDGEGGGDKNKVFKVECAVNPPPVNPPPPENPPPNVVTPPPPGAQVTAPAGNQIAAGQAAPAGRVIAQPRTTG